MSHPSAALQPAASPSALARGASVGGDYGFHGGPRDDHMLLDKRAKPENVQVVVRVRPLMPHELAHGQESVIRVAPDNKCLHAVTSRMGDKETLKQYEFSRVAGPEVSQLRFFEMSGIRGLIDATLTGINVSVFAYGQTGSGKTYSVSGVEERLIARSFAASDDAAGVIPRAMDYLYSRLTSETGVRTTVRASMAELYNEQVYDLLNLTGESLNLRWNASQGFFVQGQLVVQCDTVEDVLAVVTEGHKNRTVGSHALNLDSSRSHSLLTLMIERVVLDPDTGDGLTRRSKLVFVDLAGSERLKESKSEGLSALETRQINKSLFVLGKVIAALADKDKRAAPSAVASGFGGRASMAARVMSPARNASSMGMGEDATDSHVPYRDSKLTKLLMDSLGGNALTIMIACISPAAVFLEESLNTLQYAMRASRISNAPVVQVDMKDALILSLKKDVKHLRDECGHVRLLLGMPVDAPLDSVAATITALRALIEQMQAQLRTQAEALAAAQAAASASPPRAESSLDGKRSRSDFTVGAEPKLALNERAAQRAARQSEAVEAEMTRLQADFDKACTAAEAAKARVAALSSTTEEQRRVIDRLTKELAESKRTAKAAEQRAEAIAAEANERVKQATVVTAAATKSSAAAPGSPAASGAQVMALQDEVYALRTDLTSLRETNQMLELRLQSIHKREVDMHAASAAQLRGGSSMSTYSDTAPLVRTPAVTIAAPVQVPPRMALVSPSSAAYAGSAAYATLASPASSPMAASVGSSSTPVPPSTAQSMPRTGGGGPPMAGIPSRGRTGSSSALAAAGSASMAGAAATASGPPPLRTSGAAAPGQPARGRMARSPLVVGGRAGSPRK